MKLIEIGMDNAAELIALKSEVIEHYENAITEAGRAIRSGQEAVKAALLCGHALIKSKALLKHGEWLPWLHRLETIDQATAFKFVRLAKLCHEINFDQCASVRQAYILAGIIPQPEPKQADGTVFELTPKWTLSSLSRLAPRIDRRVVVTWLDEDKQAVRAQLEPLVRLYEELGASPSPLIIEATEAEVSSID